MKQKHIRLFSLLVASISILAVSACETSARYSDHYDWTGSLEQVNHTEDTALVQFKLTYDGGATATPEGYETLYVAGSWSLKEDNEAWSDPVALTYNSSSQTYDITLYNIDDGEYQCQLLFGYTHLETYNWEYRVTEENSNIKVTISGPTNEVDYTLTQSITEYIPVYHATFDGYTLSFTFTYSGATETVPSWGKIYIAGSWDNEGDNWTSFHELTNSGDTYTYTFTSLPIGYYTYDIVLDYADSEDVGWDHTIANEQTFEVTGYEDSYTLDIEITLENPFSTIIPEPISDYTLTISISYSSSAEYIPDYVDLYITGDFNDWSQTDVITSISNDRYSFTYTIDKVHVGETYSYQIIAVASGDSYSSSNALSIGAGDSWVNNSFTVSSGSSGQSLTFTATRSISDLVTDPNLESYTVVVKLLSYNSDASIGTPTEGHYVYINSAFDSWGTHQMTYNETDETYSFSYSSLPSTGTYEASIYAGTSTSDCWSYHLAKFNITVTGSESKVTTFNIGDLTTAYDSFSAIFTPTSYTVSIGSLGRAPDRIVLYAAGNFNGYYDATGTDWQGISYGDEVSLTKNNDDSTYLLALNSTPAAGTSMEILGYDSETEESGSEWSHEHIADYTFTGSESGSITMTSTYSAWSDIFTGLGSGSATSDTTDFYIVILNTDSSGSSSLISKVNYIKTDSCDGENWVAETIFNGSDTSSLTSATTGGGQNCVYNSVAATAASGTGHAAYVYDDGIITGGSGSTSWNNEIHVNLYSGSEVPNTNDGEYAVYLCGIDGSSSSFSNKPSVSTSFADGTTGGWEVVNKSQYATIADYVASLSYRGIKPGEGSDSTDFYVVLLNQTNANPFSTLSMLSGNTAQAVFNSGTTSTVTNYGEVVVSSNYFYPLYNATKGTAAPSSTYTAQFTGSTSSGGQGGQGGQGSGGSTSVTLSISNLTIPTISSGQIAVYLAYFNSYNSTSECWTNIQFGSISGGWNNYTGTISDFISAIASSSSVSWS